MTSGGLSQSKLLCCSQGKRGKKCIYFCESKADTLIVSAKKTDENS